jgi:hypothetical protein
MNEEIRRGEEAQRLLDEPILKEAFEAIELTFIDKLKRIDVGATEAQRDLIVSLQLLNKVKKYIEEVATTGKLAKLTEEQEGWRDKVKRHFR